MIANSGFDPEATAYLEANHSLSMQDTRLAS
jgi:hypothetical protein